MDLQVIHNLKACLVDAATRGAGTLAEDAGFKSAVDALSAAADDAASRRILLAVRTLRASDGRQRPGRLLDILALADALLCERAETDVSGELAPLSSEDGYVDALFSTFQPLLAALESSGSGRVTVIEDAWAAHPEYFTDPRVLPVLVGALDDAHGESSELFERILAALGDRAVPLLKEGGGAARIYAVARLAGAAENDWYLRLLPRSTREAREAVIAALGLSSDNALLLAKLYQSETDKKCRDAALRGLARMDDDFSRALWAEELERRPDCPPCLEGVDSPLAADMAALALRDAVEEALSRGRETLSRAELLTLAHALFAAYGKYSDAMRETWLWCGERLDTLEKLRPDSNVPQWDLGAADMLEKCLLETVLWNPCEGVRTLAQELSERWPARFLSAAVLIELILHPADAFDRYGKLIVKNSLLHRETAAERTNRIRVMQALGAVRLDRDNGRHIPFERKNPLTGAPEAKLYRLAQFDPRWAQTLGDPKVNRDAAVYDLTNPWSMVKLSFRMEWIE